MMKNAYAVLDGQLEFCFFKMIESEIRNLKLKTKSEKNERKLFSDRSLLRM